MHLRSHVPVGMRERMHYAAFFSLLLWKQSSAAVSTPAAGQMLAAQEKACDLPRCSLRSVHQPARLQDCLPSHQLTWQSPDQPLSSQALLSLEAVGSNSLFPFSNGFWAPRRSLQAVASPTTLFLSLPGSPTVLQGPSLL